MSTYGRFYIYHTTLNRHFIGGGVVIRNFLPLVRPSKGIWRTREIDIYFRETGEQRPKFEGYRGTKTILGNREHKKTFFLILGGKGNKPIYFRGTREQVPPSLHWRASLVNTSDATSYDNAV